LPAHSVCDPIREAKGLGELFNPNIPDFLLAASPPPQHVFVGTEIH
jgi:hypothetical protein